MDERNPRQDENEDISRSRDTGIGEEDLIGQSDDEEFDDMDEDEEDESVEDMSER